MSACLAWWRGGILACCVAMLGLPGPAAAQSAHPVERVEVAGGAVVEATTRTAIGRASITLANRGATTVGVEVRPTFSHAASQQDSPAGWVRLPAGDGPDARSSFALQPGETATFEVTGRLEQAGVHETWLFVAESGEAGRLGYPVRITREVAAVPADFLAEPKPVRASASLFRRIMGTGHHAIRLTGRNATTEPVVLSPPVVGPMVRVEGDARSQPAGRRLPSLGKVGCAGTIAPGAPCAFDLRVPATFGPGQYTIDVMLSGPGGGQSMQAVPIDIRAPALLAGILVAIGVALGAAVTDWRGTARTVTSRRIDTAALRGEASRLATSATQPPVKRHAQDVVQSLRALDADIVGGGDPTARIEALGARLDRLRKADVVLGAALLPRGEAAGMFAPLAARVVSTLEAADGPLADVDAAIGTLASELSGLPDLLRAAVAFDGRAGELSQAIARARSPEITHAFREASAARAKAFGRVEGAAAGAPAETVARARDLESSTEALEGLAGKAADAILARLRTAIEAALATNPPPTSEMAKELAVIAGKVEALAGGGAAARPRLAQAVALSDALDGLGKGRAETESAEPGLESGVPGILPADGGLKFEWTVETFQPAVGASAAALRKSLRRWDLVTNLIVLAAIAAVGVLVLWIPNTTWGSVEDLVIAVLAGAGTRLAIGTIATPAAPG